jgi:hypothetical protein
MNPKVVLYDEDENGELVPYTPKLTATQVYLWDLHEKILERVQEYSDGDEIVMLSLGDPTHGNHFNNELVSTRQADQITIALSNFDPWMEIPNITTVRFAIGTEVHEFGEGSSTQLIVNSLSREHKDKDIKAVNHGLYNIDGAIIDYAHHRAGSSVRIWLEGNMALYYLRDRMIREILNNRKPADLYVGGHIHQKVNVVTEFGGHESRLVICPSMCGMSGFARKSTKSAYQITNGIVLFKVIDGILSKPTFVTDTIDLRTKEYHGQ